MNLLEAIIILFWLIKNAAICIIAFLLGLSLIEFLIRQTIHFIEIVFGVIIFQEENIWILLILILGILLISGFLYLTLIIGLIISKPFPIR